MCDVPEPAVNVCVCARWMWSGELFLAYIPAGAKFHRRASSQKGEMVLFISFISVDSLYSRPVI
jgi:hypothetical protein